MPNKEFFLTIIILSLLSLFLFSTNYLLAEDGNDPISGTLSVSSNTVAVGESITLTITAQDDEGVKKVCTHYQGSWHCESCGGTSSCTKNWTFSESSRGKYRYSGYVFGLKPDNSIEGDYTTPQSVITEVELPGPDDPISGTLSVSANTVSVGENVTLTITAQDDQGIDEVCTYFHDAWSCESCGQNTSCTKTWTFSESTAGNYEYSGYVYGYNPNGTGEGDYTTPQSLTVQVNEGFLTCPDDTPYGQCSDTKPKYCEDGILIDKCSVCGCPSDKICKDDETCEVSAEGLTASIISPSSEYQSYKEGEDINFDSSVNGGTPPYTYQWQYSKYPSGPLTEFGNAKSFTKNDFASGLYDISLTVTDSAGVQTTSETIRVNICGPPTVHITSPNNNDTFEQLNPIHFEANASACHITNIESGVVWTSSIDGDITPDVTLPSEALQFDLNSLSVGTHTITISITDTVGQTANDSIQITVNPPPSVKVVINSPENEGIFLHGQDISFDSSVAGGTSPYTYSWTSNIDGNIGNSQSFTKNDLSAGDHTITLTATDSEGNTGSDSLTIHIPPDSFDWRDATHNGIHGNWMTPPQDQDCGDCWAFATIGVMEAKYNIQNNNPDLDLNLSEQYLVSACCNVGDCDGGFPAFGCGAPSENCLSYQATNTPCATACDNGTSAIDLYTVSKSSSVAADRARVQYFLINEGPLWVAIEGDALLEGNTGRTGKDGCPIYQETEDWPDHAMVLVGYDNQAGYWILKNSWGSTECGNGYYNLDYGSHLHDRIWVKTLITP